MVYSSEISASATYRERLQFIYTKNDMIYLTMVVL
jgi:hypothetical protein